MKVKMLISTVLSAVLLCSVSTASAFAQTSRANYDIVSPMYQIAENPKSYLVLDGFTATCTSSVEGNNAVSIDVEQTLQKHRGLWFWDDVKDASWTKSVNTNSIRFSNTKTGLESGKYRVKTVFTLTPASGKAETITVYSEEKTVA